MIPPRRRRTLEGVRRGNRHILDLLTEMESGFLLDVVVAQSTAILKLFSSKDKTLLIWGDPLKSE
jgi:hypothetical protein